MSLMNKFKHSVGILSSQQYTAVTAVDHLNRLIDKYNSLMDKFVNSKSDFAKETTDAVLLELLNAISEQATFMVILITGSDSEKHAHRETFKECVSDYLAKQGNAEWPPVSINFEFIAHSLVGYQDDNWRFREVYSIINVYKWLYSNFKEEIAQKLFVRKLYNSLAETKKSTLYKGPSETLSQLENGLLRNLISEISQLSVYNIVALDMKDASEAVTTLILFLATYFRGCEKANNFVLPLLTKHTFDLELLNVYSKLFKITPEESV